MTSLKCANYSKSLPTARRLKTFCSYACRGQYKVQEATADHSGLVRSKNIKQNKALQSLKRQSVGAVTFAKINSVTIRVDRPRKKGAAWLMEVAWPGVVRQRWVARVSDRGSESLALDAAKQAAISSLSECGSGRVQDWTVELSKIATDEVDCATRRQERRRWPIDLMNGRRRGFVEQREAIVEAELGMPPEDPALQGVDYSLGCYADGYPKLPDCLKRTPEQVRLSDAA